MDIAKTNMIQPGLLKIGINYVAIIEDAFIKLQSSLAYVVTYYAVEYYLLIKYVFLFFSLFELQL